MYIFTLLQGLSLLQNTRRYSDLPLEYGLQLPAGARKFSHSLRVLMDVAFRPASFSVGSGKLCIGQSGRSVELVSLFYLGPTVSDLVKLNLCSSIRLWQIKQKGTTLKGELTKQLNPRLKAQSLE
jgi:hypothetical protein